MNLKNIAIVAMVAHGAQALKKFSDADNCGKADTPASKCQKEKFLDAAGAKTGSKTYCNFAMRGHTDGSAIPEYWAGDLWGVYDTKTNLDTGKGVVCLTDQGGAAAVKQPSNISSNEVCSVASDGATTGTAATKQGWTVLSKSFNTVNGNPIYGALYCPQSNDACDKNAVMGSKKVKTWASASDAAVTVQLTENLTEMQSCSYVIEATCDAPYMQNANTLSGTWSDAGKDLTWSVLEYGNDVAKMTSADAANIALTTATNPATPGLTKNVAADLQKTPASATVATTLGGASGSQDVDNTAYPQVYSVPKGSQTGVDHSAYWLFHFIDAKRAEYDAFNTAKAAYDTKKSDYNTKLTAAEKITDAQKTDIFKAWFPTKEDTDAVKAVPTRPMKPALPAALPTGTRFAVAKAAAAGDQKEGVYIKDGSTNSWLTLSNLEVDGASSGDLVFTAGKSWGTIGWGTSSGKTSQADYTAGSNNAIGATIARQDFGTPANCRKHYMVVQAGGAAFAKGVVATKTIDIKLGVNKFAKTLDALTVPTAAVDPQTPKAGAKMLTLGAAILASSLTLF